MSTRTCNSFFGWAWVVLASGLLGLLGGCASQGSPYTTGTIQSTSLALIRGDLERDGLAFLTPSSVTGQEEDKQAVALSFFGVMQQARPDVKLVSLPSALTAINRAGLAAEYKRMLDDFRMTGLLDRDGLRKIGAAAGARYLAQIKLSAFSQSSKNRWGTLGFRVFDTKTSTARLFLQIWDSREGAIVWEGAVEQTAAYDSVGEDAVTFRAIIELSARKLIERLP